MEPCAELFIRAVMVKRMWTNSVGDAPELHRIGIQTRDGEEILDVSQSTGLGDRDRAEGVPLDKVPGRLMSFLLHFGEARLWSYAWLQFAILQFDPKTKR